nr:phytanoyl-CoA dioxygenase family protein [Aurantiacibacter rhizosphaerae]
MAGNVAAIEAIVAPWSGDAAGHRLADLRQLAPIISQGVCNNIAQNLIGPARAVRAVLFDKTAKHNWSLAWHQDRTIAVRKPIRLPGFSTWTIKQGIHHVEPPFGLLAGMATLRIHLDQVNLDNGPLDIAAGSHLLGLIPEPEIAKVVGMSTIRRCIAQAGDVWAYSTPILHASAASIKPRTRRVLQIDYCAEELPSPLQWLAV